MAARRRLIKCNVEAVEPGPVVWDTKVKGFGVRRQRRCHVLHHKGENQGTGALVPRRTCGSAQDDAGLRVRPMQHPHPPAISVIPGMRSVEEIRDNIANMATEFAPAVWDELISDGLSHLPGRHKGSVPTPDNRKDLATSGNPDPGRSPTTNPSARIIPGG